MYLPNHLMALQILFLLGNQVFVETTCQDDSFIGIVNKINSFMGTYSSLSRNLFPISQTCCLIVKLPFLALAQACHKSSLIPF